MVQAIEGPAPVNAGQKWELGPVETAMMTGDVSGLDERQRKALIVMKCEALGIDPRLSPFLYTVLDNRLVLYATKGCAEQLCANKKLTVEVIEHGHDDDGLYYARCRVTRPDGTHVDEMGFVALEGKDGHRLSGNKLANAKMKAVTKAKRRGVLSASAANTIDETEVEDVRAALAEQHAHAREARPRAVNGRAKPKALAAPTPEADTHADDDDELAEDDLEERQALSALVRDLCRGKGIDGRELVCRDVLEHMGHAVGDEENAYTSERLRPILLGLWKSDRRRVEGRMRAVAEAHFRGTPVAAR